MNVISSNHIHDIDTKINIGPLQQPRAVCIISEIIEIASDTRIGSFLASSHRLLFLFGSISCQGIVDAFARSMYHAIPD